jgi:hypothetical protein
MLAAQAHDVGLCVGVDLDWIGQNRNLPAFRQATMVATRAGTFRTVIYSRLI